MKLDLSKDKSIADVQLQFSKMFPFLKIEFFNRPHESGVGSWSKHMIFNRSKILNEIVNNDASASIEVEGDMTVNTFEQTLQDKYGLYVQVFRKSMGSWIATTESDSWTLSKQNDKGKISATIVPEMVFVARDRQED